LHTFKKDEDEAILNLVILQLPPPLLWMRIAVLCNMKGKLAPMMAMKKGNL
jgi:hypothetical protein